MEIAVPRDREGSFEPQISRLASIYVELFRNTPQLVQIIFWYTPRA